MLNEDDNIKLDETIDISDSSIPEGTIEEGNVVESLEDNLEMEKVKEENKAKVAEENINIVKDSTNKAGRDIRVGNETNTIGQQVNNYIQTSNDENKGESLALIDPSYEYYPREIKYKLDYSNADAKLENKRILFVSCYHEDISIEAANTIIKKGIDCADKSFEYRIINGQKDVPFSFLDLFFTDKYKVGNNKKLYLIVGIENETLLNSFSKLSDSTKTNVIEYLRKLNIKIIFLCSGEQDNISKIIKVEGRNYPLWNINFLSPLLESYELGYLESKILKQQELGLWKINEQKFYNDIVGYLNDGVLRFKAHLKLLDEFKPGIDQPDEFLEKNVEKINIEDILIAHPLNKFLVFIIAYFPKISLNNLTKLILILLGNETVEYAMPVVSKKGKIKEKVKTIELVELWNNLEVGGTLALRQSTVKSYFEEDGKEYFDFSEPYLRGKYMYYFNAKGRLLLQKYFGRIMQSGLYFEFNTKGEFLRGLSQLSKKMALKDPEVYGINRIFNLINKVHYEKINVNNDSTQLEKFISSIKKEDLMRRVAYLMTEMIEDATLNNMISNVLNSYIQIGNHSIVFDFIERLHYSEKFDTYAWLKKMIDNGTLDVKKKAYNMLINIIRQKPNQIYDILKNIKEEWYPDTSRELMNYSPSNLVAMALIVDLPLTLKNKKNGEYPITYPLFIRQDESNIKLTQNEENFIEWLFSPKIKVAYDELNKLLGLGDISSDIKKVFIIEKWYKIILGDQAIYEGDKETLFSTIIAAIKEKASKEVLKEIIIGYSEFESALLRLLKKIDNEVVGSKEKAEVVSTQKKMYVNQYKVINRLKKIFQKLIQTK